VSRRTPLFSINLGRKQRMFSSPGVYVIEPLHLVEGLQSPSNGPLLLFSDAEQGKRVFLTGHEHDGRHHVATVHTIALKMFSIVLLGEPYDVNEFGRYLEETKQEKVRRYGPNATFLVLEASHEEEAASVGEIFQSDKCGFCLVMANGFRDQVETRHKTFLEQSQSFLSFAMPSVVGLQDAGSCIMADHPSGKRVYVMTSSGSGLLTLSAPIPEEGPELFTTLFKHSVELMDFQTVFRLLAGSTSNRRDNLRAFLFAFTALEVFVGKFSNQYGTQLDGLTEKDHSPKIHAHLERLRREEKEHVLSYKFARVASYLALDSLDEIIDEFDRTNRYRNDIVHGNDFDESTFPTAKVRNWLSELVRLHLARLSQP
jgi:hypothetical protein